jgi:hypothetical protein
MLVPQRHAPHPPEL